MSFGDLSICELSRIAYQKVCLRTLNTKTLRFYFCRLSEVRWAQRRHCLNWRTAQLKLQFTLHSNGPTLTAPALAGQEAKKCGPTWVSLWQGDLPSSEQCSLAGALG